VKILAALSGAMLVVVANASAQTAPADAKIAVSRLLEAIKTGDRTRYTEISPKLVMMATPDFGVSVSFEEARTTFASCSLTSLSDPKPLDGFPAFIVTATMTCGPPLPAGPVTFDFMADGKVVHGIYPGGIGRFYPNLGKKPHR
jgi:hypothetical protein